MLHTTVLQNEMGDFGEGVGGGAAQVGWGTIEQRAATDTSMLGGFLRSLCSGDDALPRDVVDVNLAKTVGFKKDLAGAWVCGEILRGRQVRAGEKTVGFLQSWMAFGNHVMDKTPFGTKLRALGERPRLGDFL